MRVEVEQIKDRAVNNETTNQTMYELRRELFKMKSEIKTLELENEMIRNSKAIHGREDGNVY
jgi:hypothetical protein